MEGYLMFTHMELAKTVTHRARDNDYELSVYRVLETGEHRIFISKGGIGFDALFTATQDDIQDARTGSGLDIVEGLIAAAIDDIDRNEFGVY
jgi:hypothetical protein